MMRLVLMGDLHFFVNGFVNGNEKLLSAKDRFYESYLQKFFEIEADLHISLGDLTHLGLVEEYENVYRYIRNSGIFFRHILGNHDAYELPKSQIQSMMDHPLNDVMETNDALLVFLDSTRELRPDDFSGHLNTDQLEWLEAQLLVSPTKPVLVFAHHPVYNTTTMSTDIKMHIDPTIDIRAILGKRQGNSFYFNGHNHIHSIVREEQWNFIQTAASMCHPSFRIVEIDESGIRTQIVAIDDKDIVESAKILYDGLPRYHRPLNPQGEHTDREHTFMFPNIIKS